MDEELLNQIEQVLGIKFYDWQRKYLLKEPMIMDLRITGRGTGKTLVWVIETLFESDEPLDLRTREDVIHSSDWWSVGVNPKGTLEHPYIRWYRTYLFNIYDTLNSAGVRTRKVIF